MSWLVKDAQSRDELLALHPPLAADHRRLLDEIWRSSIDARLLEYCRLRTATLLSNQHAWDEPRSSAALAAGLDESLVAQLAHWPTHPGFDTAAKAVLERAWAYP